jgi:hypothetical protein
MEGHAKDQLSEDIDAAIARVKAVQTKRTLASVVSLAVALVLVVGGEAAVVWMVGNSNHVSVYIFAVPFMLGLPPAWAIRTAMWPKDAVI